jgi:hypothetical protein
MSAKISFGPYTIDVDRHNAEVRDLWQAYRAGDPPRTPIIFGINPRFLLQDPTINTAGITFREYISNPDVMFDTQLKFQYYVRHHIPQDQEMGLPEACSVHGYQIPQVQPMGMTGAWSVYVDLQNIYEGAWLGCPVEFPGENEAPYCIPILSDDCRSLLFDRGIPDPFKDGGWMQRNVETYERLKQRAGNAIFHGSPVSDEVGLCATGTDGPFTTYCELRGAEKACVDIALDPEYFHQLMEFITEAIVTRITAYRRFLGREIVQETFSFADDSIELVSTDMYREHILPYHRRLVQTFTAGYDNSIHLCGDASRHFKTIKDELNVLHFDTGFPIDHAAVRDELGPEVEILGGPRADLFLGETEALLKETKRILESDVRAGKKFVLREGNNLAPRSRPENIWQFYFHAREWGQYQGTAQA